MFIGEYSHTIDDKGRMSVPAKFRLGLGDRFFITKGLDHCLFLFPENEWRVFENKLKGLPITNKNARAFVRFLLAGAMECSLDKQGRVNVAQNLRAYADMTKDVMVIGVGSRVEIWSVDNWGSYNNPDNISYEDISEQMAELGI